MTALKDKNSMKFPRDFELKFCSFLPNHSSFSLLLVARDSFDKIYIIEVCTEFSIIYLAKFSLQ